MAKPDRLTSILASAAIAVSQIGVAHAGKLSHLAARYDHCQNVLANTGGHKPLPRRMAFINGQRQEILRSTDLAELLEAEGISFPSDLNGKPIEFIIPANIKVGTVPLYGNNKDLEMNRPLSYFSQGEYSQMQPTLDLDQNVSNVEGVPFSLGYVIECAGDIHAVDRARAAGEEVTQFAQPATEPAHQEPAASSPGEETAATALSPLTAPSSLTTPEQRLAALGVSEPATDVSTPTELSASTSLTAASELSAPTQISAPAEPAEQPIVLSDMINIYQGPLNAKGDDLTLALYARQVSLPTPVSAPAPLTQENDLSAPTQLSAPTSLTAATELSAPTSSTYEALPPIARSPSPLDVEADPLHDEVVNDLNNAITAAESALRDAEDGFHSLDEAVTRATTAPISLTSPSSITDIASAVTAMANGVSYPTEGSAPTPQTAPAEEYAKEDERALEEELGPIQTSHKSYRAKGIERFLNLFRREENDVPLAPTNISADFTAVTGPVTDATVLPSNVIALYNDGTASYGNIVYVGDELLAVLEIKGDREEFLDRYNIEFTYAGNTITGVDIYSRLNGAKIAGTVLAGTAAIAVPVIGVTAGPSGAAAALAPIAVGAGTNSESGPNRN